MLKSNKGTKEVWGPLVNELLELKNKLAKLKPSAVPDTGKKKKKK